MMRLALPGLSILVVSNYTRIRCARMISIIPTNCALISTRFQASVGPMYAWSLSKFRAFSMRSAFGDGPRPAVRAACT
jgi:hypothetical protein